MGVGVPSPTGFSRIMNLENGDTIQREMTGMMRCIRVTMDENS